MFSIAVAAALTTAVPVSQSRPASRPSDQEQIAAIDAWLRSDADDESALARAVSVSLAGGEPAFAKVAKRIRAIEPDQSPTARRAAELLLRDIAIGYLNSVREADLRYAGQYRALEPLQPWIGRIYTQLVVATPDWFPDNMRIDVVPALRDLFPRGPGADASERLHQLATDEEFQPNGLRYALACALAQWGDHSLIRPKILELQDSAGSRQTGDELYFVRALAELRYELRDYARAAAEWDVYLRATEKHGAEPRPLEYYNAACCLALTGRVDDALDELERCATLLASPDLDDSMRLKRALFDSDPELEAVRPSARFGKLVGVAFRSDDK